MLNMLIVDVCAYGFSGLGTGICALLTQILYGALQLVCQLLGTFVDLLNIAFYIFAGIDTGDGRFFIGNAEGGRESILDFFVFDETVTKSYFYLAGIALVLVAIFTIYKIIKQDYFDKAGPRSKGPIFRNVAISCISFLLVIPIFYLIIHASSFLAVQVLSAMGVDLDTYAGMMVFELSWSDGGYAYHFVNGELGGLQNKIGSMWYMKNNSLFALLADGELVKYDLDLKAQLGNREWKGPLATYSQPFTNAAGVEMPYYLFYAQFYWYIYFVAIIVALKAMWNLILAMIQRIFKILGLFIVAPAPISQYVLDDGAKFKKWLEQSIQEGLRLVTASFSFAIFLMVLGLVTKIDFFVAFQDAIKNVDGNPTNPDVEGIYNITGSTLAYAGEFTNIPTISETTPLYIYEGYKNVGWSEGWSKTWENFTYKYVKAWNGLETVGHTAECAVRIIAGNAECGRGFFQDLVNAFLQCLLVVAAGGAIKDLDLVLTPLISGASSSLDSGNTGGAVNAVGKAAVSVGAAMVGGAVGAIAGSVKAGKEAEQQGKDDEQADIDANSQLRQEEELNNIGNNGVNGPSGPTGSPNNGPKPGDNNGGGDDDNGTGGNGTGNPTDNPKPGDGDDNPKPGDGDDNPKPGDGDDNPKPGDGEKKTRNPLNVDFWKGRGQGAKNLKSRARQGMRSLGKKFNNSKLGKFFNKNIIGRVLSAPFKGAGKLGMRLAKSGPHALFAGLKGALKAGAKSAGSAIATAVVGKDAVGAFMASKKESNEKELHNKDRRERIANNAFNQAREDRIADSVQNKDQEYEQSVNELKTAGQEEETALGGLHNATEELNDANGQANNLVNSDSVVSEATDKRKAELDKYGVKTTAELENKRNELVKKRNATKVGSDERKALDKELANMDKSLKVAKAQDKKIQTRRAKLQKASDVGATLTKYGIETSDKDKGQILTELGEKQTANTNSINEQQKIIDDANSTSEQKEAAKKRLEELNQEKKELETVHKNLTNVSEDDMKFVDSGARVATAEQNVNQRQQAYDEAHARTVKAEGNVTKAVTAQAKARNLANQYFTREYVKRNQKAPVKGQYGGINRHMDPSVDNMNTGHMESIMSRYGLGDVVTHSEMSLEEANKTMLKDSDMKKFFESQNIKLGDDKTFDVELMREKLNNYTPKGKNGAQIKKKLEGMINDYGRTMSPTALTYGEQLRNRQLNAKNLNETHKAALNSTFNEIRSSSDFDGFDFVMPDGKTPLPPASIKRQFEEYKTKVDPVKDKKKIAAMGKKVDAYEQAYNDHVTSTKELNELDQEYGRYKTRVEHAGVMTSNIGTRVERIEGNTTTINTIGEKQKELTTIIQQAGSGSIPDLSPETLTMLNRHRPRGTERITPESSPDAIKTAAQNAYNKNERDMKKLNTENIQLEAEINALKRAIHEVTEDFVTGIKVNTGNPVDTNVKPQDSANNSTNTVSPVPASVTSNVINNITSDGVAGTGLASEDYERMQNAYIKESQDILKRVKAQNDELIDRVEDLEKSINEE